MRVLSQRSKKCVANPVLNKGLETLYLQNAPIIPFEQVCNSRLILGTLSSRRQQNGAFSCRRWHSVGELPMYGEFGGYPFTYLKNRRAAQLVQKENTLSLF